MGCFFLVASNADEHDDAFVGFSPASSNGAKYDARSDLATSSVKPSSGNVPASGNGATHPVSVSVASCPWITSDHGGSSNLVGQQMAPYAQDGGSEEKEGETVVLIPDLGRIVAIVDLPDIIDTVILVRVVPAELQSLMVS